MAVIDTSNGRGDGSQKTAKRMVGGDRSSKPPIGSSIAEKRMTKRDSLNSEERAAVDKKLLSCSEIGDARGAKSALEEGADANAKGAYGKTAFITACISNNMELAKALVKAEVDVNAKDEEEVKTGLDIFLIFFQKYSLFWPSLIFCFSSNRNSWITMASLLPFSIA